MKLPFKISLMILSLTLVLVSLACKVGADNATPSATQPPPTNTPIPTATPAVNLGAEIRMDDQGFAFRPLPSYQLDTSFGVQMLGPGADSDTGPAFFLVGGQAEPETTAQSLIDSLQSPEITISEAAPVQVDGITGLSAEIQRPADDLVGRVVAVMVTPEQQFAMFAIAPRAQWEAEVSLFFEAMLGSVQLFEITAATSEQLLVEPTIAPVTNAPVELSEISQWGYVAVASSQVSSSGDWSAVQASGEQHELLRREQDRLGSR